MDGMIMTIDAGERKSGYCVFDLDSQTPVTHGYIASSHTDKMLQDLLAIAGARAAKRIVVELSHRTDSATVKLRRMLSDMCEERGFPIEIHTAPEWRQPMHFYSKRADRDEYKNMALRYIEKNFPDHYREDMSDDEAEAFCMAVACTKGLHSHNSNKDRKNQYARDKKNYFKREEGDEYNEQESAKFRNFYR